MDRGCVPVRRVRTAERHGDASSLRQRQSAAVLQQSLSAAAGLSEGVSHDRRRASALRQLRADRRRAAGPHPGRSGQRPHRSASGRGRLPGRRSPFLPARAAHLLAADGAGRIRAFGPLRSAGLAPDRAAVRPLLYAGSPDPGGLRSARHPRAALRPRDRSGALPPVARGAGLRRPLLRQVDALPRRPPGGALEAAARAAPRVRGGAAVERPDTAGARHARDALRGIERRPPGAGDRAPRRRRGEVSRRVSHHAAGVLRGLLRRALADRVVPGTGRVLRSRGSRSRPSIRPRASRRRRRSWRRTNRPARRWPAAPASARCASTRGTSAWRTSCWISASGALSPDRTGRGRDQKEPPARRPAEGFSIEGRISSGSGDRARARERPPSARG